MIVGPRGPPPPPLGPRGRRETEDPSFSAPRMTAGRFFLAACPAIGRENIDPLPTLSDNHSRFLRIEPLSSPPPQEPTKYGWHRQAQAVTVFPRGDAEGDPGRGEPAGPVALLGGSAGVEDRAGAHQ